jgi:hypothetical protein
MKDSRVKGYKLVVGEGVDRCGVHFGQAYPPGEEVRPLPGAGPLTYHRTYHAAYRAMRQARSRMAILSAEVGERPPQIEIWICLAVPSPERWVWRPDGGIGFPVSDLSPLRTAQAITLMAPAKNGITHGVILRKSEKYD